MHAALPFYYGIELTFENANVDTQEGDKGAIADVELENKIITEEPMVWYHTTHIYSRMCMAPQHIIPYIR
eukprot:scaffold2767_cov177-Amphora_coffeaeformis.AAC.41